MLAVYTLYTSIYVRYFNFFFIFFKYIKYRENQIMEERKKNGTSLYRSNERAKYNRFILA